MTPDQPKQVETPAAPKAPPIFGEDPIGKKPGAKNTAPTFLGSSATPSQSNQGFKTLLGS